MANLKERNIALVSKDSDGVTTIDYPLTSTEMVEGLAEFVKKYGGAVKTVNGQAPDSTGNITLKIDAGGLPVGHEFFTTNPNIPAGCIPLLGGEYSRTTYADLWAWVQTQNGYLIEETAWQKKAAANGGNVPFYSKGNGSTTFRVPALKCWVRGANSISEVGGYLAAGLPNIEGYWENINQGPANMPNIHANTKLTGSFKKGKYYTSGYLGYINNVPAYDLAFDASASNAIYGKSDEVQPQSIVGLWCVKAYGTVTNVGSTDVANIGTGLTELETRFSALENNKVDKAGNAWVVETYRNGTEWYRKWSDGWIEQGGVITAKDINFTLTLHKPFIDTNYTFLGSLLGGNDQGNVVLQWTSIKTRTNVTGKNSSNDNNYIKDGKFRAHWYACGQGA